MDVTRKTSIQNTEQTQGLTGSESSVQQPRSRSISPRRVPTNELLQNGLERFVRKEKETPLPSANPDVYPHISSARYKVQSEEKKLDFFKNKYAKELSEGATPAPIKTSENNIQKFQYTLTQANNAKNLSTEALKKLTEQHAKSSNNSPFLSGTPAFTKGQNSQDSYANASNERGVVANFSILHTNRALTNPANSREHELLLPDAEQRREVAGKFSKYPDGKKIYIDTSGDEPVTYEGDEAQKKFDAAAGEIKTQN
ncbi:hypothetical protein [Burkholderia glumae]|uniref:hypothetical protein n=1 Tax=Burkholderia glumae TaxID=337 RepID=UPI003B9B64DD